MKTDHVLHGTLPPLRRTAFAIIFLLCVYAIIAFYGIPQYWTYLANKPHDYDTGHVQKVHDDAVAEPTEEGAVEEEQATYPPLFMVIPFALLLIAIAVLPLIPATEHWWHSNLNKFYVASSLGIITLLYYGFFSAFALEGHWPAH